MLFNCFCWLLPDWFSLRSILFQSRFDFQTVKVKRLNCPGVFRPWKMKYSKYYLWLSPQIPKSTWKQCHIHGRPYLGGIFPILPKAIYISIHDNVIEKIINPSILPSAMVGAVLWGCRIHRLDYCRGVKTLLWVSWLWH